MTDAEWLAVARGYLRYSAMNDRYGAGFRLKGSVRGANMLDAARALKKIEARLKKLNALLRSPDDR